MKFHITCLVVLVFFTQNIIGQELEEKNTLCVRLTPKELALGYEHTIKDVFHVGIDGAYHPRFKKEENITFRSFSINLAYTGFRISTMFKYDVGERFSIGLIPSFRSLRADKLIFDSGKFGGSNTSDYAEYEQINQDLAISFFVESSLLNHPRISWYAGVGIIRREWQRNYTIEGTYSAQYLSNRVGKGVSLIPAINFGLKFKLIRF
jgi:hypothetical protein